jgi:hypothetical protein
MARLGMIVLAPEVGGCLYFVSADDPFNQLFLVGTR